MLLLVQTEGVVNQVVRRSNGIGEQRGLAEGLFLEMTSGSASVGVIASVGGVIVDRLNRKRLLISCDIVRAGVMVSIPLLDTLWELVLASLVLELATSLWGPAKEAIVPNVVPTEHLTTANSLSLLAAYGTFPFVFGGARTIALHVVELLLFIEDVLEHFQEDGWHNRNTSSPEEVPGVRHFVNNNNAIKGRILAMKTSHHGSNSASSRAFINHLRPSAAFISTGKINQFAHPAQSTVNVLDGYPELPANAGPNSGRHSPQPPAPPYRPVGYYLTGFQNPDGTTFFNKTGKEIF